MPKILLIKAKYSMQQGEKEKLEKEIMEKTGLKAIIIDKNLDVEIIEGE